MRKTLLAFASLVLAVSPAFAQHDHGAMPMTSTTPAATPAAPHPGRAITFAGTLGEASGYLAEPSGGGTHGAVIVIQEWWGMNDWVKDQADHLAAQGYVALAVDLYRGKVATDPETAHELMRGLPEDRALADMEAGFNYLAGRKDVDAKRIGSIGWCMGGGYSLALAVAEPRLAACVINYGRLVSDPATIARIHAPILGHFGGLDKGISTPDIEAFQAALKKAGKSVDIKIYPDAGHGFMNSTNAAAYQAADTKDAWSRIDPFFAKRIGGKK